MVGASAGCVWGWLRPSRVDVPAAGQAGGLAKAGAAARRRAGATIQACTVGTSAISRQNEGVDTLQGQLLIASPSLLDSNFRRTVVLVTEHTDEGAAGLVLNRPSPASVSELVPELEPLAEEEEQVWLGGPVQPNAVLVLGEFVDPDDAAVPLFGTLGFPSLEEPEDVLPATTRRRVFAGYAGWGAGQLETELERDDWIVEPALNDDAFTESPDHLWADVLRRKGGIYELVARMPEDPSVN